MTRVLAVILAGGVGERLYPLTRKTAKPAVPFGGIYRIIDFTLSNCINSNVRRVFVLTQYKALELNLHIREGWSFLPRELGEFIEVIPPMKRVHEDWYLGTADAVFQNIESIIQENPRYVLILAGDHIYKMDYGDLISWHVARHADITLATTLVTTEDASRLGVLDIDEDYRIVGFEEKPTHGHPFPSRFNPSMVSASMGVYVFSLPALIEALRADAANPHSSHDFGRDILPAAIHQYRTVAYDFRDLNAKTARYWRDVGTIEAYYEANMDLVAVTPELNLYDSEWPMRTLLPQVPPAKFVFAEEGRRMGIAVDSIVSGGCIISGGRVMRSVLSPGVRVNSFSDIDQCIVMHHANVGRNSHIRRTIIEPWVRVPENSVIGYDLDADRAAGHFVSDGGIVVVSPPASPPL